MDTVSRRPVRPPKFPEVVNKGRVDDFVAVLLQVHRDDAIWNCANLPLRPRELPMGVVILRRSTRSLSPSAERTVAVIEFRRIARRGAATVERSTLVVEAGFAT